MVKMSSLLNNLAQIIEDEQLYFKYKAICEEMRHGTTNTFYYRSFSLSSSILEKSAHMCAYLGTKIASIENRL